MNNLYKSSDFVWALFLGHRIIEKLLKGLLVKNWIESVPRLNCIKNNVVKLGEIFY